MCYFDVWMHINTSVHKKLGKKLNSLSSSYKTLCITNHFKWKTLIATGVFAKLSWGYFWEPRLEGLSCLPFCSFKSAFAPAWQVFHFLCRVEEFTSGCFSPWRDCESCEYWANFLCLSGEAVVPAKLLWDNFGGPCWKSFIISAFIMLHHFK